MADIHNIGRVLVLGICLGSLAGCADDSNATTRPSLVSKYPSRGPRKVPDLFKDTVMERADIENDEPFLVSGYGLVTQLRSTGDNSNLPTTVRDYMIHQLQVHGYATLFRGLRDVTPEKILRDKRAAVVRVDGFVPPGARQDDTMDIQVSALEQSYTTSLAHGILYTTELRQFGADPNRPGGSVNTFARSAGPVFVNPAYALNRNPTEPMAKQSLRFGTVMDGGIIDFDNPLDIRVRDPQMSTARLIERRVNERYQTIADKPSRVSAGTMVASAQDEAHVYMYMPKEFQGDWQHFTGVVKHLYLSSDPAFLAGAAERLAAEAQKPDAPLEDISYALEGIGQAGLAAMHGLLSSDKPDVVYAAARAAFFVVDESGDAQRKLRDIASTPQHPFRINAVQPLATALRTSPEARSDLRKLASSDNSLVRIAAYRALCKSEDQFVFTKNVRDKFALDLIPSSGPPMVYATRQGLPRVAIFGTRAAVDTPLTFSALDARLTITAEKAGGPITIFFRTDPAAGEENSTPIIQTSKPDLADLVARLGGEGADDERRFDFAYADVVAIIQALSDAGKLHAATLDKGSAVVQFNLQEGPTVEDAALAAPRIPDLSRPQTDDRRSVGSDVIAPQIPDAAAQTPAPGPVAK